MIIQCTECQTRFKLADEKMKPAGVKVRCTHCQVVFTALPPAKPATEIPPPEVKSHSGLSDTADFSDLNFDEEPAPASSTQDKPEESDFDFGEFNMEDLDETPSTPAATATSTASEPGLGDLEEFSFDEPETTPAAIKEVEAGELPPLEGFDLDDGFDNFDAPEAPDEEQAEERLSTDEISFDDEELSIGGDLGVTFDADDNDGALPELDTTALGTQEFSFDDSPDEALFNDDTDSKPTGPIEFSFDADDDPFALPDPEPVPDQETEPSAKNDFIFEETEAEELPLPVREPEPLPEPPKPQVAPQQKGAPSQPAAPSLRRSVKKPKTKKRKKRSGYRAPLLFLLLLIVAGAGYAYFGWQQGTYQPAILIEKAQLLAKGLFQGQFAQKETGQIEIVNLHSSFVTNQNAGSLFVVHGEARNDYQTARSTISVRGIIYDSQGKAILQQTAYCGNHLDEAALRTLPYSKIEETMNNQFGDALSNLNLDPGQAIPFTIVFRNMPDKVADFAVELADSRPGTK